MNVGIQISSFKPLMTDAAGLDGVLSFMREIGCRYTALQWIGRAVPAGTIAELLQKHGIKATGVQDKTAGILADSEYYIELCSLAGGDELCFSGVPNGDVQSLMPKLDALEERALAKGIHLSYHPVKADFAGAAEALLRMRPALRLTPDVCQIRDAGLDPAQFILSHSGRIDTVHFKDRNESGALCSMGKGVTDFESALTACLKAGAKLILAEQETWTDAFGELKAGFEYTKALLLSRNA